jgi:excisionase family DNA binding protein
VTNASPSPTIMPHYSMSARPALGSAVRFVRELVARRELPIVRIGRLVRFQTEDIDAYVEACRQPASRGPLRSGAA